MNGMTHQNNGSHPTFKDLVKIKDNRFIDLGELPHDKLEAAFYFACYHLGQHQLADETIKRIDDPGDKADIVIRAWDIAYCRLGKGAAKKVTTKKAKKMFSKHPGVAGDFIETSVPRLWLSIEENSLKNMPSNIVSVVIPPLDSHALVNRTDLPSHRVITLDELKKIQAELLKAPSNQYTGIL
ncbi:hypothetical protein [Pseudoalteromonas sp. BDTF-M6]|uniref:hypothetical protein n=1 Tax=Pseudoalteromonas sp. BDTF-M6 TaxID=2796132 RepID=UPI001BAE8615|nr:hypothetical protein [Pseudoalteromonas sp. BDTF-M6]MBS3798064.1 hypothetical protein [Pseudoalteromonas sp. BDTF-M6]